MLIVFFHVAGKVPGSLASREETNPEQGRTLVDGQSCGVPEDLGKIHFKILIIL